MHASPGYTKPSISKTRKLVPWMYASVPDTIRVIQIPSEVFERSYVGASMPRVLKGKFDLPTPSHLSQQLVPRLYSYLLFKFHTLYEFRFSDWLI